jgi:hypothetical protein
MASTPPPLPPLKPPAGRLYPASHVPKIKTKVECSDCGNFLVRGLFPPVYCHNCRNNQGPISGWAFFHRTEMELINLLREHGHVSACLAFVKHELNEARMRALNADVERSMRLTEDPAAPKSPMPVEAIDDTRRDDLGSGDEVRNADELFYDEEDFSSGDEL